jgi:hypothetical protein
MPEISPSPRLVAELSAWYEQARQRLADLSSEAEKSDSYRAYDEAKTDLSLEAFDHLGVLLATLQREALPSRNAGTPADRRCLRCGLDLAGVMGVYVFVAGRTRPGLLCVEHGNNGANNLSAEEYDRLTAQTGTADAR